MKNIYFIEIIYQFTEETMNKESGKHDICIFCLLLTFFWRIFQSFQLFFRMMSTRMLISDSALENLKKYFLLFLKTMENDKKIIV